MHDDICYEVAGRTAVITLALSCDLRFEAAGAKLVTSYARLGLPAE